MRIFLRGLAVGAMVIGSGFALGCQSGQGDARIYFQSSNDPGILDGETKSILVNGYSTSFAWPDMLQDMLDDHADGERRYHIVNSVIGGAPVESWIGEPGSRDYERTITAMELDFMGSKAGKKRLTNVLTEGGFTRIRRAYATPFNLVLETRV